MTAPHVPPLVVSHLQADGDASLRMVQPGVGWPTIVDLEQGLTPLSTVTCGLSDLRHGASCLATCPGPDMPFVTPGPACQG